jgi:cyclic pyranopterin phosphate synthase
VAQRETRLGRAETTPPRPPRRATVPPPSTTLTHVDATGAAHMVEVGAKAETAREAIASGEVHMTAEAARLLAAGELAKGDALAVARIAAISATKQAHLLIPLCHPVRVTGVDVELVVHETKVAITVAVRAFDRTGVEMEAMTAVAAAALTIYDMAKAVDRGMVIGPIMLEAKRGGRSGVWTR